MRRRHQPRRAQRELSVQRRATGAEVVASRIDSTRIIGEAVARAKASPRVWLQASTATIYAHRYDADQRRNHRHPGRK